MREGCTPAETFSGLLAFVRKRFNCGWERGALLLKLSVGYWLLSERFNCWRERGALLLKLSVNYWLLSERFNCWWERGALLLKLSVVIGFCRKGSSVGGRGVHS